MEAQTAKDRDALTFEMQMREKLAYLEQLITESKDSVMNALESDSMCPNHSHPQCQRSGDEEIQVVHQENDIIEGNANFMEGINEPDEAEEIEADDEENADEEFAEAAAEEPDEEDVEANEEEIAEEEIGEADVEQPEEEENVEPENVEDDEDIFMRDNDQEDAPGDPPEGDHDGQMVERLEQQFRNAQQALRNFEEIVHQLDNEYICPPR
ncbi:hypothetical protein OSTOST_07218, partial [Ostertagia ostertagi]